MIVNQVCPEKLAHLYDVCQFGAQSMMDNRWEDALRAFRELLEAAAFVVAERRSKPVAEPRIGELDLPEDD